MDAIFLNANEPFFIKTAYGLLIGFLADAEHGIYHVRGCAVGYSQKAVVVFECLQNPFRERVHLLKSRRMQAEIDFAVIAQGFNIAPDALSGFQRLKNLIFVQDAPVGVIDDGAVFEGRCSMQKDGTKTFETKINTPTPQNNLPNKNS